MRQEAIDLVFNLVHDALVPSHINVHFAKTHLSRLLARVATGEEIILARAGTPVAVLSPIRQKSINRDPGWGKGQVWLAPDFDTPLTEEEVRAWYGGQGIRR